MKIAVFSDVHDNLERWKEADYLIKKQKIELGICCGDITNLETLRMLSKSFKKLYLVLGNADYSLADKTNLFPENIEWYEEVGEFNIDNLKIAIVHNNNTARDLTEEKKIDIVFYGHTHTPWEERLKGALLLNPGEICGRYGQSSFAVFDTKNMKAELILLN